MVSGEVLSLTGRATDFFAPRSCAAATCTDPAHALPRPGSHWWISVGGIETIAAIAQVQQERFCVA
jgi:hypothetical protein